MFPAFLSRLPLAGVALSALLLSTAVPARPAPRPAPPDARTETGTLHPKVVILGYFETSKAFGEKGYWGEADKPGELHHWLDRLHLDRKIPVPGAFNPVWANADGSVIAMKIGPNSLHPAVNVTALGLDPHFDLRRAYWLVNGIAGTSPETGTIGDVVWTDYVVNGDVAHEIDAREIPANWESGYFPAGSTRPYPEPRVPAGSPEDVRGWEAAFHANRAHTVFQLNPGLLHWAYRLTAAIALPDDAAMRSVRADYAQAAARAAPKVAVGATLSAETFWLGARMDQWARHWTGYMTDGRGTFRTTETNDAGTMMALTALGQAGRADPNRVLLLRAASNFDSPPAGIPAAEQLVREGPQNFAGYLPALEGLYRTGSRVVTAILDQWPRLREAPPADAAMPDRSATRED